MECSITANACICAEPVPNGSRRLYGLPDGYDVNQYYSSTNPHLIMQPFNLGDPVTCIVYGDGHVVDFDDHTDSPLVMWVNFEFQSDSIPYTFDGRLHPKANITLSNVKYESEKAIRYNQGKSTWSLVDFATIEDMVAVLDFGAKKYSPDNWKKGLYTKSVFDSIMRHLTAYLSGEDNDQESGLPHTGHIMCNAMFLAYMHKFMPSFDNRTKTANVCPYSKKESVSSAHSSGTEQ